MSRPPWGNDLIGLFRGLSRIGSAAAEIRSQEVTKAWATSSLRPAVAKGASSLQETITNALQDPQMMQASVSKGASEALSRISLVAEGIKAYRTQTAPLHITKEVSEGMQEVYDPIYDPKVQELSIEDIVMHEAFSGHTDHIIQPGEKSGANIIAGIGNIADAAIANVGEVKSEVSKRLDGFEPLLDPSQLKKSEITEDYAQAVEEKLQELEGAAFGYNVGSLKDAETADEILVKACAENVASTEDASVDTTSSVVMKDSARTDIQELNTPELSFEDVMMQEALSSHDNLVMDAVSHMETGGSANINRESSDTNVKSEAIQRTEQFDHLIESLQFEEKEITQEHLQAVNEKLTEIQNIAYGHDLRIFKEFESEKPIEKPLGNVEEVVCSKDSAEASGTASESNDIVSHTQKDQMSDLEKTETLSTGTSNAQEEIMGPSEQESINKLTEKESAELELDNTIAQVAKCVDLKASEKIVHDFDVEVHIEPKIETKPLNVTAESLKPYPDLPGPKSPSGISETSAATGVLSGTGLAMAAAATAGVAVPGASAAAAVAGGVIAATKYQEKENKVQEEESKDKDGQKLDDVVIYESTEITMKDIPENEAFAGVRTVIMPQVIENEVEPASENVVQNTSDNIFQTVDSETVVSASATEPVSNENPYLVSGISSKISEADILLPSEEAESVLESKVSESVEVRSPEFLAPSSSDTIPHDLKASETTSSVITAEKDHEESSEHITPTAGLATELPGSVSYTPEDSEKLLNASTIKSSSVESPESVSSEMAGTVTPDATTEIATAKVATKDDVPVPAVDIVPTSPTNLASVASESVAAATVNSTATFTPDVEDADPSSIASTVISEATYNSVPVEKVSISEESPESVSSEMVGTVNSDATTEIPKIPIINDVPVPAVDTAPSPPANLASAASESVATAIVDSTATYMPDDKEVDPSSIAADIAAAASTVTSEATHKSVSGSLESPESVSSEMAGTVTSVVTTEIPKVAAINDVPVPAVETAPIPPTKLASAASESVAAATTVDSNATYTLDVKVADPSSIATAAAAAAAVSAAASTVTSEATNNSVSVEKEKKQATASKPKPKLLGRKPLAKDKPKSTLADNAQARKVPHSRLGRMLTFGGLAAGLGAGTIAEMTRRTLGVNKGNGSGSLLDASPFLTEANAKRIVDTLCKVRGAALKLGQMMSIQDSALINPQVQKIFERVRQSADFMPAWQLEKAITEQLGGDWKSKVAYFDEKPFAAASIGQVHQVNLLDGRSAAMKIQYPGVAEGIDSDINNLMSTLKVANIIPEGLYVDSVIEVAKKELGWECDYVREAACTQQYRELIRPYSEFYVPEVISEFCTPQIFTSELIEGIPVDKCVDMDQDTRNFISEKILRLCMLELFRFGFMQTDPNWSNFFYNADTEQLALLDFGACRSYDKSFVDKYIHIIHGAASKDRGKILQYSQELGFLTGYEAKVMVDAHIDAIMILGEAFQEDQPFQFGSQDTTHRIQHLVPVMLSHRMCAPPEESYSLHRKMSGVFLLCAKLNGVVKCKPLFEEVFDSYKFGGTWKEFHDSLKV